GGDLHPGNTRRRAGQGRLLRQGRRPGVGAPLRPQGKGILMPKRAVVFDLFGTLVEAMRYKQYQAMLADMAAVFDAPHAAFVREWEATLNRRFGGDFSTIEANLE